MLKVRLYFLSQINCYYVKTDFLPISNFRNLENLYIHSSKFSVYSYNNTVTKNVAVAQNNICSFSSYTGTILVFGIYYASYSNSSAGGGTAFIGYNDTKIIASESLAGGANIGSNTEPSYFAFNITADGTLHIYATGSCNGTSTATVKYNILIIRT